MELFMEKQIESNNDSHNSILIDEPITKVEQDRLQRNELIALERVAYNDS